MSARARACVRACASVCSTMLGCGCGWCVNSAGCRFAVQDFPTAGVAALAPGTPVFAVCTPRRKAAQPCTPTAAPSQPTQAAPSPRGDGTSGDGVDSGSVAPSLTAPVPPDVGADTTSGDGTPPHRRPSRRGNRNRPSSDAVPVAANATPTHVVATADLVNWLHEECPYKCGYSHAEPAERCVVSGLGLVSQRPNCMGGCV